MDMNLTKEFYTTGEIARMCGLKYQTVSRWLTKGLVIPRAEVRRTSLHGNYRVTAAGVRALLESQTILPTPPEPVKVVNYVGRLQRKAEAAKVARETFAKRFPTKIRFE